MSALMVSMITIFALISEPACSNRPSQGKGENIKQEETRMPNKVVKTDEEWKELLTPEQYRVLRKSGTERPFSGIYNDHYENGVYTCAACGTPLFKSETKYDHGTGWPSFTAAFNEENVGYHKDFSHLMIRTEVRCAVCGSHLGHIFSDGPPPTHKHYCINSAALNFAPANEFKAPDEHVPQALSGTEGKPSSQEKNSKTAKATFAAGCFWGVEYKFRQVEGVISTRVGYSGGKIENPIYMQVCSDKTGHAEAVEIIFDPLVVSYSSLLERFFEFHDPTQLNKQGPDVGSQYRSVVFYHDEEQKKAALETIKKLQESGRFRKPIVTQVVPASVFYQAEDYHQQYYEKIKK